MYRVLEETEMLEYRILRLLYARVLVKDYKNNSVMSSDTSGDFGKITYLLARCSEKL
jgi:hypothetical protein